MRKPVIALLLGVVVAFVLRSRARREKLMGQVRQAAQQAKVQDAVHVVKDQAAARKDDLSEKVKETADQIKTKAANN